MQKTFTFNKTQQMTVRGDYTPLRHLSIEQELKDHLLKKGFLILKVEATPTITVNAICAKANVPFGIRIKMQKQIDKKGYGKHGDKITIH